MKLCIKEKILSLKGRFFVRDEAGQERYAVQGDWEAAGNTLRVYDMEGVEIVSIQEIRDLLTTEYRVLEYDEEIARIRHTYAWFKPRYDVSGLDWVVTGSLTEHRYTISKRGQTIATIRRKWLPLLNHYELDCEDEANEVNALAVLLVINFVLNASIK